MKKWIVLIIGTLIVSGTAHADCGACDAPKKLKKKAACKMEAAQKKSACQVKSSKGKATGKLKAAKQCGPNCKKPCCAAKEVKDNASEKAQEVRKKWWKFGLGE